MSRRKELLIECSSVGDEQNNTEKRKKKIDSSSSLLLFLLHFCLTSSPFFSSSVKDAQLLYSLHMHTRTYPNIIHLFGMRGVALILLLLLLLFFILICFFKVSSSFLKTDVILLDLLDLSSDLNRK